MVYIALTELDWTREGPEPGYSRCVSSVSLQMEKWKLHPYFIFIENVSN